MEPKKLFYKTQQEAFDQLKKAYEECERVGVTQYEHLKLSYKDVYCYCSINKYQTEAEKAAFDEGFMHAWMCLQNANWGEALTKARKEAIEILKYDQTDFLYLFASFAAYPEEERISILETIRKGPFLDEKYKETHMEMNTRIAVALMGEKGKYFPFPKWEVFIYKYMEKYLEEKEKESTNAGDTLAFLLEQSLEGFPILSEKGIRLDLFASLSARIKEMEETILNLRISSSKSK